jgi:hypothetical protein
MPSRRNSTGFIGVRARPSDAFYAEICAGGTRLALEMFDTVK